MDSLWGKSNFKRVDTPISILEEQIKHLENLTEGKVYGFLERDDLREKISPNGRIISKLCIRGDGLSDYRYSLFSINHDVDLYPVIISMDKKTFEEVAFSLHDAFGIIIDESEYSITNQNENEYIQSLRVILSSDRMKKLITNILSLTKEEDDLI